jgi:hypothetical protein
VHLAFDPAAQRAEQEAEPIRTSKSSGHVEGPASQFEAVGA